VFREAFLAALAFAGKVEREGTGMARPPGGFWKDIGYPAEVGLCVFNRKPTNQLPENLRRTLL